MIEELKPCPFCGGDKLARILHVNNRASVCCYSCTAKAWEEDWQKRADHIPDASKMIWVSADDRLPDEGQEVLYYTKVSGALLGRYREDGVFGNVFGELAWGGGVYWMPLPEPPNV